MRVLVTGSRGFIGKNLCVHLAQRDMFHVATFDRGDDDGHLARAVERADVIVHLAGANRPQSGQDFERDTVDLTARLCAHAATLTRAPAIFFASSRQAECDSAYGASKRAAERSILRYAEASGAAVHIERLPNVFGKWCRPNYNSVFATFCHNVAHDLPVLCHDRDAVVHAAYVDDVCETIGSFLLAVGGEEHEPRAAAYPVYSVSVGELADTVTAFRDERLTMLVDRVGTGFLRALHATYLSYLPVERFVQPLAVHSDSRGVFVEMLKTRDSGQFSFFSAGPCVTRGGHYHHTKTEKFLVLQGQARFRFEHILTGERHEVTTSGDVPVVVDTIPGWTHDITNTGQQELLVMLWASEIFDRARPDTYARGLQ